MQDIDMLRTRPSFEDVLVAIDAAPDLTPKRKKELRSDVVVFCSWLNRDPQNLPADAYLLRPHVSELQFGLLGVSRKRFGNVKSSVNTMLARADAARPHTKQIAQLSPAWKTLWDGLQGSWLAPKLSPLFRYADALGLSPDQIDDAVVDAYAKHRHRTSLSKDPTRAITDTRCAWNKARATIPGWPRTELTIGTEEGYLIPWEGFPESFQAEVKNYGTACRGGHISAPTAENDGIRRRYRLRDRSPDAQTHKPLAETTIAGHLETIRLAASTLVREGECEVDQIQSIRDVISLDTLELVADAIIDRNGGPTEYGLTVGKRFRSIAVRWLKPSKDDIDAYNALLRELKNDGVPNGIRPKNRERLRVFDDPVLFSRLISLPERTMVELERVRKDTRTVTRQMALQAEAAMGILILTTLPVRRSVLVRTHLHNNVRWPVRRHSEATLHYGPREETKTGHDLSAILAPWKVKLLRLYRTHYQPILAPTPDNGYAFPGQSAPDHLTAGGLAKHIVDFIYKRLGIVINLHLFRHLMASKILADNPENTALVERLLGQSRGSRSTAQYAEIAVQSAARHLETVIEREEQDAKAPRRKPSAPRAWRLGQR